MVRLVLLHGLAGARKLKKKRGFARKKDAEQYERDFLHKGAESCDMTFSAMVDLYLEDMGGQAAGKCRGDKAKHHREMGLAHLQQQEIV